jgi:hypothetical protein
VSAAVCPRSGSWPGAAVRWPRQGLAGSAETEPATCGSDRGEQLLHSGELGLLRVDDLLRQRLDLWWRSVVVPAAVAALMTGVVSSVVSGWGLLRHYCVVVKPVSTVLATVVLLVQLRSIDALAVPGAGPARASAVVHAIGGLVVLLGATVLGGVKPRGLTRRGIVGWA